jgi:hypothetical protein
MCVRAVKGTNYAQVCPDRKKVIGAGIGMKFTSCRVVLPKELVSDRKPAAASSQQNPTYPAFKAVKHMVHRWHLSAVVLSEITQLMEFV